jgi:hypothetical protein
MTKHRFGHLVAAVAFLAAAACSGQVGGGSATGFVKASLALPPSAVTAIRVTVTGNGIAGFLYGDMTDLGGGNWVGTVPNVPPGGGYLVTAYAYDGPVPSDPINDSTNLIYKGAAADVSITAGLTTPVFIVLIPYPNGGGGPGVNTPPHIVFGGYPTSILSTDSVELSAAAWDPDEGTVLSYEWDDGGAGGAFSGNNPIFDQVPGNTVTIDYTPAASFSGIVTIRLTVSDGEAEVSKTISFGVVLGTGAVDPTLVFDSGPEIAILAVSSQELTAGSIAQISYEAHGDDNGGSLNLNWTDSCSGGFSGYQTSAPPSPFSDQAIYITPAAAPASPGECDLTLTVTDSAGASTWSRVVVWVSPPGTQDQTGKVVFVTSAKVDGAYFNGNPATADALCQQAADAGTVPAGTYTAFVSFQGVNAKDRIPAIGPYYLPDGTPVAAFLSDMLGGTILHAIDRDEHGALVFSEDVWTGTLPNGTFDPGQNQCMNWTSNQSADRGSAGSTQATDSSWVRQPSSGQGYWCSDLKPIYCFQNCAAGYVLSIGGFCVEGWDVDPIDPGPVGNQ